MARSDAERLEIMKGLRDQAEDRLSEMLAKPRPTYKVDAQEFDFTEYQKFLRDAIKGLNEDIKALEVSTDVSGGPTETQLFA